MSKERYKSMHWLGSQKMCLDEIHISKCFDIVIGCYGGSTQAGAYKNEDAAYIMCDNLSRWRLAILFDAHATVQSAELIINTIQNESENLLSILNGSNNNTFENLRGFFLHLFSSEEFCNKCKNVKGETACLICMQKDEFLWWFSVGDNLLLLLNSELEQLGQFALNQRNFYEWIGYKNTFDLEVPCFSSGTRELREGTNYIYLITDGVLECGNRQFENYNYFYEKLTENETNMVSNIRNVLEEVQKVQGRDNATIIGWSIISSKTATMPSS